jgi:hypothetical protein
VAFVFWALRGEEYDRERRLAANMSLRYLLVPSHSLNTRTSLYRFRNDLVVMILIP